MNVRCSTTTSTLHHFRPKHTAKYQKILKNHKDKDAGIIAKERVGEGMPWICIFDVSVGVTVFKCKKRGAAVVQKVLKY